MTNAFPNPFTGYMIAPKFTTSTDIDTSAAFGNRARITFVIQVKITVADRAISL